MRTARSRSNSIVVMAAAGMVACSFLAGRMSVRTGAQAKGQNETLAVASASEHTDPDRSPKRRPSLSAPVSFVVPRLNNGADDEASATARASRTTFLIDSVFKRLALMSKFEELPSAEAQATAIAPYVEGLLEGALQSDP